MIWYMGLDKDNRPNGWDVEPWGNSIAVDESVKAIHTEHPDYVWNGVTLAPPLIPEPQPYVPTEEERVSALWQAAHDYEYAEISGSAVGMLAIGVMQGLPKCLAVQAWIKSIWELYYARKFGTSTDTDYSSCGVCPYSVPELMQELGL